MPSPMTIEMNITENTVRCPTVSVTRPRDHVRLRARTASMTTGSRRRRKASSSRPSVSAKARPVASRLSAKAARIPSVGGAGAIVEPEIQEMRDERAGEPAIHAVEERDQPRLGGERFDEVLVLVDILSQLRQCRRRQVEQRTPGEVLGRHTVREMIEGDRPRVQRAGEAGRERPGRSEEHTSELQAQSK